MTSPVARQAVAASAPGVRFDRVDALRGLAGVRVAVVVTTDKVYRNREWAYPYREDDALGGHDPYSASKAATELVTASYRDSFLAAQGIAVATARAGNVIGGGDWAEDRLIPDFMRAIQAKQKNELIYFNVFLFEVLQSTRMKWNWCRGSFLTFGGHINVLKV